MKQIIAALALLACAPVIIALAWLVRMLFIAQPKPGVDYPYDDNDPGVDVDCPAGEQVCEQDDLEGVPDQATLELLGYNDAVEFLEYRARSRKW